MPYPRTLLEFQAEFPNDAACEAYLLRCRWPKGFRCPRCARARAFVLPQRNLWQCKACGYQSSLTSGTVLHRTHTSLHKWFWAAYLVATHTPGLSALQLKRHVGIARYETAWLMLHKLRKAMLRPGRGPLSEKVEADESYIGNQEGLRGRELAAKRAIMAGVVEVRGRGSGRVRLKVIPDASADVLTAFIKEAVEPNAIVITDGWQGYAGLRQAGYRHRPKVEGTPERGHIVLPRIHRVFGNLKMWLRGTHHGVSKKHLQAYLDEFTFRFNRRHHPMAAFRSLLGLSEIHSPTSYDTLVSSEATG